jgi:hypothetical protein
MLCARRILRGSSGGHCYVLYSNNSQTDSTHCCSNAWSNCSPTPAAFKALLYIIISPQEPALESLGLPCLQCCSQDDGGSAESPSVYRSRKIRFFYISWHWTAVDCGRLQSVQSTVFFGLVRPNTTRGRTAKIQSSPVRGSGRTDWTMGNTGLDGSSGRTALTRVGRRAPAGQR